MDLGILTNVQTAGDAKLGLQFGPGYGVRGIEKATQVFITFFLTDVGTLVYDPTFGTPFMADMRAGLLQTDGDILAEFNLATILFFQYNNLHAVSTTPTDERVTAIKLLSSNTNWETATLTLHIQITTAAGTSRPVTVPVSMIAT